METQQLQGQVPTFKNLDVRALQKSDPSQTEFEYPKILGILLFREVLNISYNFDKSAIQAASMSLGID
jgi:hypothetical protein